MPREVAAAPTAAEVIARYEGFRATPYNDPRTDAHGRQVGPNIYRAGYGSDTITRADGTVVPITPGMVVTQEDARRDLDRRITTEFQPGIINVVGQAAWDALPDATKAAITSVAYNYGGIGGLPTLARAIRDGDTNAIADAISARGDDNGGVNSDRRAAEAQMVRSAPIPPADIPTPPPLPRARPLPPNSSGSPDDRTNGNQHWPASYTPIPLAPLPGMRATGQAGIGLAPPALATGAASIPPLPSLAATGSASMGLAPPAIAGGSAFIPPPLPRAGSVGVPMQLLGPDQAQQQVASNIANETPAPGPNTPYSVTYGTPPPQSDMLKGGIINAMSHPGPEVLQPAANALAGLGNWLAPPTAPPAAPQPSSGGSGSNWANAYLSAPQNIPSLPASANQTIYGQDVTPSYTTPTSQGRSPDDRQAANDTQSAWNTGQGIAGTAQLPANVRPKVTVPTLPAAPTTKTISVTNPAYTAWMNNQTPTPPALPGSGLSVSGGATGGIGQGGYASGSIAIPHNSTPAPPHYITRTVPVPQVTAPIPLSPPQDELAAIRAGAENPFQRAFDGTPLGHIANFAGNLANGGAHYGAPASGGLLGLLSGGGGGGGGLGGLLGALTPGSNIAAMFGDMSGAQQANQNPAAMAAGLAGQSYYSAPNGAAIPILAMNGNPRNSYGDAANHIGSSLTQSWF